MTRNSVPSARPVQRIPRKPNTYMRHDRTHPTGPDNAAARVVGTAATRLSGETKLHSHSRHQFIYSVKGVMDFITPEGRWILPPSRALWIGAGVEHALRVKRPVDMHILYIDRTSKGVPAWPGCAVVNVTPLVRELVAACVAFPWDYPEDSPNARLATVLLEQLSTLDHAPVQLREPKDPRARRVLSMLRAEVGCRTPLEQMAPQAAASARTIERLFLQETGLSFGEWRQRYRLIQALEQLAEDVPVAVVSGAVGYENPSSFITAFKKLFGTTPGNYFR